MQSEQINNNNTYFPVVELLMSLIEFNLEINKCQLSICQILLDPHSINDILIPNDE